MNRKDLNLMMLLMFVVFHAVAFAAIVRCPFTVKSAVWLICSVYFRWLGFSCAVHRYFSHRVCRTSRWFQFLLGVWGTLTMARSPIKFASGHRHHHLYSDRCADLHSPRHRGFLGAYIGWVVSKSYDEKRLGRVGDLLRYPELRWLNKYYFLPNLALCLFLYKVGGNDALTYGGLASVIVTWHIAFASTVLFHNVGSAAYRTGDESKNSFFLGLLLCGEGWHNNHHANARSARLGHEWWQFDAGYWVFVGFERLGLIWNLNKATGAAHSGIARLVSNTPFLVDRLKDRAEPGEVAMSHTSN